MHNCSGGSQLYQLIYLLTFPYNTDFPNVKESRTISTDTKKTAIIFTDDRRVHIAIPDGLNIVPLEYVLFGRKDNDSTALYKWH